MGHSELVDEPGTLPANQPRSKEKSKHKIIYGVIQQETMWDEPKDN
jgi:hypothetical protein